MPRSRTWRDWIHKSHHPYVERQLNRWMAEGHQVTFDGRTDTWQYKGESYHNLSEIARRIHNDETAEAIQDGKDLGPDLGGTPNR